MHMGTVLIPDKREHTSVILYTDDAVLLSQTQVYLKRMLEILDEHCQEEHLEINYTKIKVMVFAMHPKKH
ncbi:hypothetical protein E2320_009615, partial [Naja naja]